MQCVDDYHLGKPYPLNIVTHFPASMHDLELTRTAGKKLFDAGDRSAAAGSETRLAQLARKTPRKSHHAYGLRYA